MSGQLPSNPALALGQFESSIYLRKQLLRDSPVSTEGADSRGWASEVAKLYVGSSA